MLSRSRVLTLRRFPVLIVLGLGILGCRGSGQGEVLVLVNEASPISVAIGEAYIERRGIPKDHLVRLEIPLPDPLLRDDRHETIAAP